MATMVNRTSDDEDVDVKREPELSSVVASDETHVKQKIKEEPMEHIAEGSSLAKIYTKRVNMDSVIGKITNNEDISIKRETEQDTVVVFDEVHVKQEVNEESVDHAAASRPPDVGFHDLIRSEIDETSQSVYCNICWTYCEDAKSLKRHLEVTPWCMQQDKAFQGVDRPDDASIEQSYKIHEMQTFDEFAIEDTDAIPSSSQNSSTSNITAFVKPLEINTSSAENLHTCHICKKNFARKSVLETHKLKHIGVRPFACDVCNQTFTQKAHLKTHKVIHTGERPFICNVCNQTFTRKSYLNLHKVLHTGERPFSCDVCNQTFTQKSSLNTHKLIHTGERPFTCDVCNQTFTQKGRLNSHKLLHTADNPFSCKVCNQTFSHNLSLNIHKLTHTGEKPFSCDVCNQSFTQRGHLNIHKLKHTGERPFPCNMCNKSYTQKSHLKVHKLKHTGESAFTCDMCNRNFTQKSNLIRHMMTHK